MKPLLIAISLWVGIQLVQAQQDSLLWSALEQEGSSPPDYVMATFKGTRLINFHTIETGGKRALDFRISHRFGEINGGLSQFFGLDGGANIRLGLEYSPDGNFQVGIGRSAHQKMVDGFVKYRLIKQANKSWRWISLTWVSGMYITTVKDPMPLGLEQYPYWTNRLSYLHQLIIARKFNAKLSLQIAPGLVHYNLVPGPRDKNDCFVLAVAGRYKLSKRIAITAEYAWRLNPYSSTQQYYDAVGIGADIETGGHVFQLHFTNAQGIADSQYLMYNTSDVSKLAVRLGFNISRVFTL